MITAKTQERITIVIKDYIFSCENEIVDVDTKRKYFEKKTGLDYNTSLIAYLLKFLLSKQVPYKEEYDNFTKIISNVLFGTSSYSNSALHELCRLFFDNIPPSKMEPISNAFQERVGITTEQVLTCQTRSRSISDWSLTLVVVREKELDGDYMIGGIKVKQIYDNFIWQDMLRKREESLNKEVEDKLQAQLAIKKDELKELEDDLLAKFEEQSNNLKEDYEGKHKILQIMSKEIELKENDLLRGFKNSNELFKGIEKPSLAELQAADFITADEKRIICGLLPKTN